MANVARKSFEEVLTQGSYRAIVRSADSGHSGYSVHVTGRNVDEHKHFYSKPGALAYARLRLAEVDPGSSAVSGMGDVMHRAAMGNPYDEYDQYTLSESDDDDGEYYDEEDDDEDYEYEDDDDEDGDEYLGAAPDTTSDLDTISEEELLDADEEDLEDMAEDLYDEVRGEVSGYASNPRNPRNPRRDKFSNLTLQAVTLTHHHGLDMGRESKAKRWPSTSEMRKKFKEAIHHIEPEVGKLSGSAKAQLQSTFFQGYRTGHDQIKHVGHKRNPGKEAIAHSIVANDERELMGKTRNPEGEEGGDELAGTSMIGSASIALYSANPKTGISACTYASNASCPSSHNSSHACPFLNSGCYANYDGADWQRKKRNASATKAHASAEDVANDEAACILAAVEQIKEAQAKGSRDERKAVFHPLRLHVVGDCVTAKAASTVASAAAKWGNKVWTYTHAWRDVPRSAWGSISVLASCETLEEIKKAQAKGYSACMVQPHKTYEDTHPRKDAKHNLVWVPCPNEATSRHGHPSPIKCAANPKGATAANKKEFGLDDQQMRMVREGCRLCWSDGSNQRVIVFVAHGSGASGIIRAINNVDGTKVRV